MVLGVPIGTDEFVRARGAERLQEEKTLLELLPELPDIQCAWILMAMCAVPRANHLLRSTPPSQVAEYARAHDYELWLSLNRLLGTTEEAARDTDNARRKMATLPARLGGVGLRSAERTSTAAYWASWNDALKVLKEKRPALAERLLSLLDRPPAEQPACLREASEARQRLRDAGYEELPSWRQAADGTVVPPQPRDAEAGEWPHGWQFHGSSVLEHQYRTTVILPSATPQRQALIGSQSGYAAGKWLTTMPKTPQTTLTPLRMQVALRFRLHYSLPLGPRRCHGRTCRDDKGVHRVAYPILLIVNGLADLGEQAANLIQVEVFIFSDRHQTRVGAPSGRRHALLGALNPAQGQLTTERCVCCHRGHRELADVVPVGTVDPLLQDLLGDGLVARQDHLARRFIHHVLGRDALDAVFADQVVEADRDLGNTRFAHLAHGRLGDLRRTRLQQVRPTEVAVDAGVNQLLLLGFRHLLRDAPLGRDHRHRNLKGHTLAAEGALSARMSELVSYSRSTVRPYIITPRPVPGDARFLGGSSIVNVLSNAI